jgi:hypothetical protein
MAARKSVRQMIMKRCTRVSSLIAEQILKKTAYSSFRKNRDRLIYEAGFPSIPAQKSRAISIRLI